MREKEFLSHFYITFLYVGLLRIIQGSRIQIKDYINIG